MELRLQQFIESTQKLSDVRNLDRRNPVIFEMEHPVTATKYQIAGSILEPSYLGVPINTVWIVLDPSSKYYMMALKLRESTFDVEATDFEAAAGFTQLWTVCRTYDDLWEGEQYYTANKGPKGDKGDPGAQGKDGVVDYEALIAELNSRSGSITIDGPDHVGPNSKTLYRIIHTLGDVQTEIFVPLINSMPQASVGMLGDNVLQVGATSGVSVKLHAYYSPAGVTLHAEKEVDVTEAEITGLTISGSATVFETKSTTFVATATFSDGSSKQVAATWAADAGTIDASGSFTAPTVNADQPVVITASYLSQTAQKQITVRNLVATGLTIVGAASVAEGTTAQFTMSAAFNDGSSKAVSGTWSIASSAATISDSGLLTANQVSANTNVTINASASIEGVNVSATKTITITNVAAVRYPKFGVGPFTPKGMEFDAFIKSLSGTGTSPNSKAADFSLDLMGANKFAWYACPVEFGTPAFLDVSANLPYAMGGATRPGISIPASANLLVALGARPLNVAGTNQFSQHAVDQTSSDAATTNHCWYNSTNGKIWKKLSTGWSEVGAADTVAALKEGDYFFDGKEAGFYKYVGGVWVFQLYTYPEDVDTPLVVSIDGIDWNVYRSDRGNLGLPADNTVKVS